MHFILTFLFMKFQNFLLHSLISNRRQAGEDSDPEEVIAEWKSKTRNGEPKEEEEPVTDGPKSVTKEWWAAYVTEEDQHKLELSNKLFLLFEILKMCEEIGDKV